VAGENAAALAASAPAPVIWLAGTEWLAHPEIGPITSDLVQAERHVFLHTDGYSLRQRIHAFRPDSRLFLTLEFSGREETHNRTIGRTDAFRRLLEGIRAAKLSGFLVAAHFTVTPETDVCEIGELIEILDEHDVDGFIATSRGQALAPGNASLAERVEDVRAMIRCGRWESFSRILDASYAAAGGARSAQKLSASDEGAYEEGD
jgi:MoaA/NifB/PqqE/SkfB family radical SAM enzyme